MSEKKVYKKPACPDCGAPLWDNIHPSSKKNPRGPDLKCSNKEKQCDFAYWAFDPTRKKDGATKPAAGKRPAPQNDGPDDCPF